MIYCDSWNDEYIGKEIFGNSKNQLTVNDNSNSFFSENDVSNFQIFEMNSSFKSKPKIIPLNNINPGMRICTCSKTKCLKKYCECLANNQYCYNCNCIECHNKPSLQKKNLNGEKVLVTCTCIKSNCNKKYCECYKIGDKCNDNCRCINCLNNDNVSVDERIYQKKFNYEEYTMERISILIENKQIYIDIQPIYFNINCGVNFNFESNYLNNEKLLNQKRNRCVFYINN